MPRLLPVLVVIAVVLALPACGGRTRYVNQNADLGAVKTVAILPFENLTNDKLCAERVNKIFLTELLNVGAFEVVEPGLVIRTVRREASDIAQLTAEDIKRIGSSLKAQALVIGSVLEFEERRGTSDGARVKLQFRLVDTQSAATIWSVTRSRAGLGFGGRVFGLGGPSATELAEDLVREELAKLGR